MQCKCDTGRPCEECVSTTLHALSVLRCKQSKLCLPDIFSWIKCPCPLSCPIFISIFCYFFLIIWNAFHSTSLSVAFPFFTNIIPISVHFNLLIYSIGCFFSNVYFWPCKQIYIYFLYFFPTVSFPPHLELYILFNNICDPGPQYQS